MRYRARYRRPGDRDIRVPWSPQQPTIRHIDRDLTPDQAKRAAAHARYSTPKGHELVACFPIDEQGNRIVQTE